MSKKTRRDTSQKRTGKRSVNTSEVTQSHESSWKCNLKAQWNIPIPRNGQRDKDKNVQLRARMYSKGLPLRLSGRESACQGRKRCERCRFDPWIGEVPCRREWQPTPVFLPGEFHGQRSPTGYSPQGLERVRHDRAPVQTLCSKQDPRSPAAVKAGAGRGGGGPLGNEHLHRRMAELYPTEGCGQKPRTHWTVESRQHPMQKLEPLECRAAGKLWGRVVKPGRMTVTPGAGSSAA